MQGSFGCVFVRASAHAHEHSQPCLCGRVFFCIRAHVCLFVIKTARYYSLCACLCGRCACVPVCPRRMSVRTRVHVRAHLCACVGGHVLARVYGRMCVSVCACVRACASACVCAAKVSVFACVLTVTRARACVRTLMSTHNRAYVGVCFFVLERMSACL